MVSRTEPKSGAVQVGYEIAPPAVAYTPRLRSFPPSRSNIVDHVQADTAASSENWHQTIAVIARGVARPDRETKK